MCGRPRSGLSSLLHLRVAIADNEQVLPAQMLNQWTSVRRWSFLVKLCLITVTYNSEEVLPGFLDSLEHAVIDGGVIEVVAVDNASTDGTLEILASRASDIVTIRSVTNDGYAAGINRAMKHCEDADAYLVLNPDARLLPGSIQVLADCLQSQRIGIVVPKMLRSDGSLRLSLRRSPSLMRVWVEVFIGSERASKVGCLGDRIGDISQYESSHSVAWASGAAMMISRECIELVGPWDETFFLYSEETDFCLRARSSGLLTYYCAEASVVHIGGQSRVSPELFAILTLNRIRCYRKHFGVVRAALFATAIFVKQTLRLVRSRRTASETLRYLLLPKVRNANLRRMRVRGVSSN